MLWQETPSGCFSAPSSPPGMPGQDIPARQAAGPVQPISSAGLRGGSASGHTARPCDVQGPPRPALRAPTGRNAGHREERVWSCGTRGKGGFQELDHGTEQRPAWPSTQLCGKRGANALVEAEGPQTPAAQRPSPSPYRGHKTNPALLSPLKPTAALLPPSARAFVTAM